MSRLVVNGNTEELRKPKLSDYTLLRCIGQGSYGDVWLARAATGGFRAVKIIYRDRFQDARPFERELEGLREYDRVSRKDEGLVHVLHVSAIHPDGYFYYVMELADDETNGQSIDPETYNPRTLELVLQRRRRLPFKEAVDLSITLSKALGALHKRGLVHRDVKPSNIIYVDDAPKLADIGMITQKRDLHSYVGTEGFMPPEGPGSPQADVYSLGKVLYEACMGKDRKDFPQLPDDIDKWPEAAQVHDLNEVLLKACDNDWRSRHQSAEELYADLVCLLNGQPVQRLRLMRNRLRKAKRWAFVGGAVILVLAAGTFEVVRENNRRNQDNARVIGGLLAEGIQDINSGNMIPALRPLIKVLGLDRRSKEPLHRTRIAAVLDQTPMLEHLFFNTNETTDGAFSGDGKRVVIATRDGKVHVRDAQTGQELAAPFGPSNQVETASFNPAGDLVLVASQNRTATLWEWKTGRRLLLLPHRKFVFTAHFDHTGSRFVTSCDDKIARVWNTLTGEIELSLSHHTDGVSFAAFSPDDEFIVTTSFDQTAVVSRASNGERVGQPLQHRAWVTHACFSPDGTLLITASLDKQCHIWDWREGRELSPGLEHGDGVSSAEFSPDGALILTTSWDMTARLWWANSHKPYSPNPVLPHSGRVLRGAFARDGHRLITSCYDGTSRIWDLAGAMPTPTILEGQLCGEGARTLLRTTNALQVHDIRRQKTFPAIAVTNTWRESALNANGKYVLCVTEALDGLRTLCVFNGETAECVSAFSPFNKSLASVGISDSGQWLAFWSGKKLHVFELASKAEVVCLPLQKETISSAVFSPSGEHLAVLAGHTTLLVNISDPTQAREVKHSAPVKCANFTADGRYIVTACSDDLFTQCTARVWEVATGEGIGEPIRHRDGVLDARLSPSQRYFASASEDFTAFIRRFDEQEGGKQLAHKYQVQKVCFSENEEMVLTIDREQFARIWDANSGDPITPLLPHAAKPSAGAFLDNGSILTADKQGLCRIWPLQHETLTFDELTTIARVLNGDLADPKKTRFEGYSAMIDEWNAIKRRHPERFTASTRQINEWHRLHLYYAEREARLPAADFHRQQLMHK